MRAVGSGAWAGVFTTHVWIDRAGGVTGAVHTRFLPVIPEVATAVHAEVERAPDAALGSGGGAPEPGPAHRPRRPGAS